jgi:hypothetical protein
VFPHVARVACTRGCYARLPCNTGRTRPPFTTPSPPIIVVARLPSFRLVCTQKPPEHPFLEMMRNHVFTELHRAAAPSCTVLMHRAAPCCCTVLMHRAAAPSAPSCTVLLHRASAPSCTVLLHRGHRAAPCCCTELHLVAAPCCTTLSMCSYEATPMHTVVP